MRLADGRDLGVGVEQLQVLILVIDGHKDRRPQDSLHSIGAIKGPKGEGKVTLRTAVCGDLCALRYIYYDWEVIGTRQAPSYPDMVKKPLLFEGPLHQIFHLDDLLLQAGRVGSSGHPVPLTVVQTQNKSV